MVTPAVKTSDQGVQTTLFLVQDILGPSACASANRDFAVRLWDGTVWRPEPAAGEPTRFTIVLQHPGALRKMFLPPNELTLGEAYIYNDFDIEGDIEAVFSIADQFLEGRWGKVEQLRYGQRLLSRTKRGQPRADEPARELRGR